MASLTLNIGPLYARQFADDYNCLAEIYDDHASAKKIIRITDKTINPPLCLGYQIDELALTMSRDPKVIYEETFSRIGGKLERERQVQGRDPFSGRPTYKLPDDFMLKSDDFKPMFKTEIKEGKKALSADYTARKKIVKYGRY